ncbi:amidohydrolase family protein [Streptomyces sp. NPDC054813]
MANAGRIDVHSHVVPPFWGEALPSHGGDPSDWTTPHWSPEAHLKFTDDNQIATSILSLTAPSVVGWQSQERRDMARRVNEYVADLVTRHPGRFGNFATVPLPDIEGAVSEAEHALDEIGADSRLVVAIGLPLSGSRNDCRAFTESGADRARRGAPVIADDGHQDTDLLIPHRRQRGQTPLTPRQEAENAVHRRARVEHALSRLENRKILRDCLLKGNGVHQAMLGIARLHYMALIR